MADLNKFIEDIKSLTVVELNDLVKKIEETFGVWAAAPAEASAEEEKTEFNVVLKDVGANKIAVIKAVREITGLGLSEAKALVDGAPSTIKENVPTKDAKEAEEKLKAAGATVELK